MHITQITPAKNGYEARPAANFLPTALNPLREALAELEYIIAQGHDLAIETRGPFVIERCEFAIGRVREAMSRANGQAYVAAQVGRAVA
ncbi:hypothetical protein [Novosphingobium sp. KN65.2]|uniref:hypothetical protein n=1 Tax=Novosphingobium sp. KN65.2 TaxID=1478134 RepID=UPI0005E900F9|nr:hypothetical protein [Novosphingobium sp. KN65.2]CDO34647.1 hypothetical protein SPHV1_1730004 [Novosphingobium sp. KN65.2]